jgi:transposase
MGAARRCGAARRVGSHETRRGSTLHRFFARIKQYRRVATRYDKKAQNFLGFVWLASIAIMLA